MSHPVEIEPVTVDELKSLAATYRDAGLALDQHRERLHDRVAEAADAGMSMPTIARALGVSTTRVYGIVARVYSK